MTTREDQERAYLEERTTRAAAALLDLMKGAGAFLLPIPGTEHQQYVAAGTLENIGRVMMTAEGDQSPVAKVIISEGNGTALVMLAPGMELKVGQSLYIAAPASPAQPSAAEANHQSLVAALSEALKVIDDYLDYEHNGDPWTEDRRAMGEMEIDDYGSDGRMEHAREILAAAQSEGDAND